MNIFYLSKSPSEAASYLCDAHVNKMLVESCQLLNNVLKPEYQLYKPTHENHPCALWLMESKHNILWLLEHADCLLGEYRKRYGEYKPHKCETFLNAFLFRHVKENIFWIPKTPPVLAMPKIFHSDDPVFSYRKYYAYKAITLKRFTYTNSQKPEWLADFL